jgi:alcohol dehydrogenase class IV
MNHNLLKHTVVLAENLPHYPAKHSGSVIALGGGTVIDKAKLVALPKPCYVIPTNACGSAMTSHAVVWTKTRKVDIKTPIPIFTDYAFLPIKLSAKNIKRTMYDCLCHIFESFHSVNATDRSRGYCNKAYVTFLKYKITKDIHTLIEAGNWAGRAIEITGTNFIHAISYVYTLKYGLCHGDALEAAINIMNDPKGEDIMWLAKSHRKFFNSTFIKNKRLGNQWHEGIVRLLRNDSGLLTHRSY